MNRDACKNLCGGRREASRENIQIVKYNVDINEGLQTVMIVENRVENVKKYRYNVKSNHLGSIP